MSYANRYGFDFFMPGEGLCTPKNDMSFRRSAEWVPIETAGIGRSYANPNGVKYSRTTGMLPKYGGHVPGEIFDVGHTYGHSTIDAKRWLALRLD